LRKKTWIDSREALEISSWQDLQYLIKNLEPILYESKSIFHSTNKGVRMDIALLPAAGSPFLML